MHIIKLYITTSAVVANLFVIGKAASNHTLEISSVEKHKPVNLEHYLGWDGSTDIAEVPDANDKATFLGQSITGIGTAIAGSCAVAALYHPFLYACAVTISAQVFLSAWALFYAYKAPPNDVLQTIEGPMQFHYPSIPDGPSMWDRVQDAFANGDGMPALFAELPCTEDMCQRIWYSHNIYNAGTANERKIHTIHATPADFDFRTMNSSSYSPVVRRQEKGKVTKTTDGPNGRRALFGGYVWEYLDDTTLKQIVKFGNKDFTNDILDKMNSQAEQPGKKFSYHAVYCMDFKTLRYGDIATGGYLFYYYNPSSYQSGQEMAYLNTCSEGG